MKKKVKKKQKNNMWKESVKYLKETRNYIYAAIGIFFVSAIIGFLFSDNFSFFNDFLKELVGKIEGLNTFELIWFIFQNNVLSAFFAMTLGIFLGIFPVVNAIMNGTVLGYVFSLASAREGFSVILLLLPHGIFELPAVFIALGLGMRFGMFIFAKNKKQEFNERLSGSIKVFFTVVLPLLAIAAIIEGIFITTTG